MNQYPPSNMEKLAVSDAHERYGPGPEDNFSLASSEKDIAAGLVPDHAQAIDPTLEKRVLRRIDLYLIPWMWIGYGLVYYDKVIKNLQRINDTSHYTDIIIGHTR